MHCLATSLKQRNVRLVFTGMKIQKQERYLHTGAKVYTEKMERFWFTKEKLMAHMKRTEDNPHGWGYTETRTLLPHYQLSPRIQIVVGDVIKVSKGTYYKREDGSKINIAKRRGRWVVKGIFENGDGDVELDISQQNSVLQTERATIRINGGDYPSTIMKQITRRPYKIKLAVPRYKRKRKSV